MGADGGLYWMHLRQPDKRARAIQLIAPLGFLGSEFRDEDDAYLRAHPIDPQKYLISRYGTDLDHDGLRELQGILRGLEDRDERTFEEIALDLATCPDWEMFQLDDLQQAVLRACSWSVWYDYRRSRGSRYDRTKVIPEGIEYLGALKELTVAAWAAELHAIVHWQTYEGIETWT